MELRQTLIDVTHDARGWLKAYAQDFDEDEAKDTGGAPLNPIAWQLGHIANAQDEVFCLFTGEDPLVPEELRGVCATGSPTPTANTQFPPLEDLWSLLERTMGRLVGLIEQVDEGKFDMPPKEENPYFHSLGQAAYEIALHENYHVGMIGALRKALGKKKLG